MFTFRNLTLAASRSNQAASMQIVTVKRPIKRLESKQRTKFSDLARNYFDRESIWHFAMEAMLFGTLALSSAWPLLFAAQAVNQLLLRT